jgi:hypothetical protein
MSPLSIPCANQPLCPNYVERLGELCSTCRPATCPYCHRRSMPLQVTGATVIDLRDDYQAVPQKGQGKSPVQIADAVRYVTVVQE